MRLFPDARHREHSVLLGYGTQCLGGNRELSARGDAWESMLSAPTWRPSDSNPWKFTPVLRGAEAGVEKGLDTVQLGLQEGRPLLPAWPPGLEARPGLEGPPPCWALSRHMGHTAQPTPRLGPSFPSGPDAGHGVGEYQS